MLYLEGITIAVYRDVKPQTKQNKNVLPHFFLKHVDHDLQIHIVRSCDFVVIHDPASTLSTLRLQGQVRAILKIYLFAVLLPINFIW